MIPIFGKRIVSLDSDWWGCLPMITIIIIVLFNNRPIPLIQIISRKFVLLNCPLCKRPAHSEKQTNYLHRENVVPVRPFWCWKMTYATNRGDVAQVGHLLNVKNHSHPYSYHERGVPQYFSFYCHFAYSIHLEKRHIKISISCHVVPNWAIRQERAVWRHEYVRTQQQSEYDTHGSYTCSYTWSYSTIILTRMSYMINHRDEWLDYWWLWKLHFCLPRWWWTKFNFGTKGLCGKKSHSRHMAGIIGLLQPRSSSKSPSIQFF